MFEQPVCAEGQVTGTTHRARSEDAKFPDVSDYLRVWRTTVHRIQTVQEPHIDGFEPRKVSILVYKRSTVPEKKAVSVLLTELCKPCLLCSEARFLKAATVRWINGETCRCSCTAPCPTEWNPVCDKSGNTHANFCTFLNSKCYHKNQ